MASLGSALRRLVEVNDRDICLHRSPVIFWPDARTEGDPEQVCDCGLPRLIVTVAYEDGSDLGSEQRRFQDAITAVVEGYGEDGRITLEERLRWATEDFGFTYERLEAAARKIIPDDESYNI